MRRREFIALFAGVAACPLKARAQPPAKVWRIAYLSPAAAFTPVEEAFEKSLEELGWVKDQNIKIEYRYTGGQQDKVAPLVAEDAALGMDLFVAWGPPLAVAVKKAAPQIPLVFLMATDGIEWGLVSNVARPGGNVTGISSYASEQIGAKRLELLKEIIPSLTHVALLWSMERNRHRGSRSALGAAAKAFSVELDEVEVHTAQDLDSAMRGVKDRGAQAVYVASTGFAYAFAKQISDAANAHGLPSIHTYREGAFAGGLLAYATDLREQARRGAAYVDKILRGVKPGRLPVEPMSKVELLINLKTAKALGLTIPPELLARADEVIE